jgi:hypothetical protein
VHHLEPSAPRGSHRARARDDFRKAYVGLSRARWLASTVAEKRRILVEIFVQQLEPMRDAWRARFRSVAGRR